MRQREWHDMGENAVDPVHFRYLHGASGSPTNEQEIAADDTVSNFSRMHTGEFFQLDEE